MQRAVAELLTPTGLARSMPRSPRCSGSRSSCGTSNRPGTPWTTPSALLRSGASCPRPCSTASTTSTTPSTHLILSSS
eukprot:2243093-Alexandrium_andersonii.AAC.1